MREMDVIEKCCLGRNILAMRINFTRKLFRSRNIPLFGPIKVTLNSNNVIVKLTDPTNVNTACGFHGKG